MTKEPQSNPQFLEHACVATRMIDKRRQLFDVQDEFSKEKAEYERQCEILQRKEQVLAEKDIEFQQSLVKFEAFTKKNESNYLRASKRLAEETKLNKIKDEEAARLHKLLEEKREEEKGLREIVNKKKRYLDYLESSAPHLNVPKYMEAFDILNRYEVLRQTSERTKQRQDKIDAEISTHREKLNELILKKGAIVTSDNDTNSATATMSGVDDQIKTSIARLLERLESRGKSGEGILSNHSPDAIDVIDKISHYIQTYIELIDEWEKTTSTNP